MAAEYAYKYDYGSPAVANPKSQPLPKAKPEVKRDFKKYENPLLERLQKEKAQSKTTVKVACFLMSAIIMFGISCYSFNMRDEARRNYLEAKEANTLCLEENKELNAKLCALATAENIDKYAVEVLGMVKVTSDKEVYLNSEAKNQAVFYQEKQ